MVVHKEHIKAEFVKGLNKYVREKDDEQTLTDAYEYGRRSLQEGWGELDVINIYHESLNKLKQDDIGISDGEVMNRASHYLAEWLAPYQVRLSGYKDLIDETKEKNKLLEDEIEYRHQAEESLKKNKRYFQSLIENAQDIITVLDYGKRIQYISPSVKKMLGYEQEELTGKDAFRYFHPDDSRKMRSMINSLVKTKGQTASEEFRFKHKEGHWVYLESVAKNAEDGDEEIIVVNSRDITKRKSAREALEEQSKQLSEAQKIAKVGNWKWIPDEKPELYWSDELCRIFGIKPKDFKGTYKTFYRHIHPDDRKRVSKIIKRVLKNRKTIKFEHRIITASNEEKTLLCRGYVKAADEDSVKVIGTAQDITEQKKREKELHDYSQRLRNLSGRIEDAREEERISVAKQIHDELGQMLSVLKMDISLLFGSMSGKVKSEFEEVVDKETREVIGRMDKILQSVQRITTELRPEVLDDLGLKEAIDWQAKQFGERAGIDVEVNSFEGETDFLNDGQSSTIFRIFQETLTNIMRHAEATSVNVNLRKDKDNFYLTVNDNGVGISQKQLKNSSSLGIIGMRERSQLLGGDVEIEGNKETGTTVTIRIPTDKAGNNKI
ncbi:MAG TPA: PAS domain-containing protein [Balneolaceae bacterium]